MRREEGGKGGRGDGRGGMGEGGGLGGRRDVLLEEGGIGRVCEAEETLEDPRLTRTAILVCIYIYIQKVGEVEEGGRRNGKRT